MYKVYEVTPGMHYYGYALVAAHSAAKANEHISAFKEFDANNKYDSYGWTYVSEDDAIEGLFADREGILHETIQYTG